MISSFKKIVSLYNNSRQDWSTKRRLVVLESDDWGSIRMPNIEVYNKLLRKGFTLKDRPFERFDSIATNDDLSFLFDLLLSFRDIKGNSPVITANVITANPNFEKIRESDYQKYYYEEFTQTLRKYDTDFSIWQNAISDKIFFPQFHGREHLNVSKWMKALNEKGDDYEAFEYGLMGVPPMKNPEIGNIYQTAFDLSTENNLNRDFILKSVSDGIDIFEKHFKYRPEAFIAPVYTWDAFIEEILKDNGIKYLQSGRFQKLSNQNKSIKHHIGELKNGLTYNVRNSFFEPSTNLDFNLRYKNLEQLKFYTKLAFKFNKPLTVSLHRLNFIGRLEVQNRDINLDLFQKYLKWLLDMYPQVEFLTTIELMEIINDENSHT